jgi:hypothetical protein
MKRSTFYEFFFPAIAAYRTNKEILSLQIEEEKHLQAQKEEWLKKIGENAQSTGKMADDLYNFEMQRLNILARKATSILGAAGFVISLMSLTLVIKKDWLTVSNIFSIIGLIFIALGIIYFVTSAISASEALRLSSFRQITIGDVKEITTNNSEKWGSKWTAEKLVDVNQNLNVLLTKTNWLDSAQNSFLIGILLTALSYLFILLA